MRHMTPVLGVTCAIYYNPLCVYRKCFDVSILGGTDEGSSTILYVIHIAMYGVVTEYGCDKLYAALDASMSATGLINERYMTHQ